MTEDDKKEIAVIIREELHNRQCSLGIKPETAQELINFADTWKHARRALIGGLVVALIGALLAALWQGIKVIARQP